LAAAVTLNSLAAVANGAPPVHARVSLAQTAHWLLGAGRTDEAAVVAGAQPPEVPADPYLVRLSGAGRTALVVTPPGQVGDHRPSWRGTTVLGADAPAFATAATARETRGPR